MPLRLDDEECLEWLRDPSVSPFVAIKRDRETRRNILSEDTLNNPRSFLNRVKRKCFYNTALRPKIIERIKEYQKDGTMRLYIDGIEYRTPPFTRKECERWLKNHLENPRPVAATAATAAAAAYDKISVGDNIYIELIYTSLQYGLPPPLISIAMLISSALNKKPEDKLEISRCKEMKKLIEDIKNRLKFMKENNEYFLNHNVGSFDDKLKIASPRRKAAAEAATNPFGVSSSTSKSLNSAEKRQLRDKILERKEEETVVAIHRYKKGLTTFAKKNDKAANASNSKEDIDSTKKEIFITFKAILRDLRNALIKGGLVKNILEDAIEEDKEVLTNAIRTYFDKKGYNGINLQRVLKENGYDTVEGIIHNFINNMFAQLIDPSTQELPSELEIGVLSYSNISTHLKVFYVSELYDKIMEGLYSFITPYIPVFGSKAYRYYIDIINDTITKPFVEKRTADNRDMAITGQSFQNFYYKLLYTRSKEPKKLRLPTGWGLLTGKELTKKIIELNLSFYLETYPANNPDIQTVIMDTKVRGFTYEECKNWVILPIFNPRTFKGILIDSPIYNTLLITSYQYDTNLIPRMITSRGYNILRALTHVIEDILFKERVTPQSREELEKFINNDNMLLKKKQGREEKKLIPKIGLKWKNTGAKKPKEGTQLMGLNAILNAKGIVADRQPPFYLVFTEDELAVAAGAATVAKNSYIEIAAYYVMDISGRAGSKWKKVINLAEGEAIEKEGVEINNKGFREAFLVLKNLQGELSPSVSFSKTQLATFGLTTEIAKNSYVKLAYYYKPVFKKGESDIKIKPSNNAEIKKRGEAFVAKQYYTVADCLRWARQPNKEPKTQQIILTDGEEYNAILEQALVYDYNITPINITAKGKRFIKKILKIRNGYLTIAEKKSIAASATSRGKDIADINSVVCNAINNMYDEDKKYKMFKKLMIDRCKEYNKEPVICITGIRDAIEAGFYRDDSSREDLVLRYYQDSALASLLAFYDEMKNQIYDEDLRDIFVNDFNIFYVIIYEIDENLNVIQKDAIDAGGPKREFFTKLFEELFCDDEHTKRLFACPVDIIGNRYYINPNFEPDANFRKVIAARNKNNSVSLSMPDFETERDYEYIYYVIGKLLCLPVYNEEIGLPKQLSSHILAGLIYQPREFKYYDLLYFYLCEFNNGVYYINMANERNIYNLDENSMMSFNDTYKISRTDGTGGADGAAITKDNFIKFILQQAKHAVSKNFIASDDNDTNSQKNMTKRYASLFAGFSNEIRKILYKEQVSIEQLSSLITNEQLTEAILQELVDKIYVSIPEYDANNRRVLINRAEKVAREDEMKGYISNIILIRRNGVSVKDHLIFIKKLLQYWTAFNYFNKKGDYNITFKYGQGIDIRRYPEAHTCSNAIDVYGYPDNTTPQEKEKFLYDKFKIAVEETGMELR
jgi:hypothetical protein